MNARLQRIKKQTEFKVQGKCVCIEAKAGGWYVITPDAKIVYVKTKKGAEGICKRWFTKGIAQFEKGCGDKGAMGIGTVEWQFLPEEE